MERMLVLFQNVMREQALGVSNRCDVQVDRPDSLIEAVRSIPDCVVCVCVVLDRTVQPVALRHFLG